jgi:hypothetical protein
MGSYTELNCAFSLKRDTPEEIGNALLFMTGQDDEEPERLPKHPLFSAARWRHMLRGSGADVDAEAYGDARVELSESSGRYRVSIRRTFKNFDEEIEKFVDWITPYIFARPGDFIGYTRSGDVEPVTLLLYPNRTFTRQLPDEIDGEPV